MAPQLLAEAARAPSDFYAGLVFGWQMVDIKANMDACYPDDLDEKKLMDDFMKAVADGDQDKVEKDSLEMQKQFQADIGSCDSDKAVSDEWNAIGKVLEDFAA